MDASQTRTRRNIPVETWAVVRDAYLGGETAPSIARRLKLSENTIRKRATRCGWTHRAHADALARAEGDLAATGSVDSAAGLAPLARAAVLLEQGRGGEALTLIRAAEALNRAMSEGGATASTRALAAELEAAHGRIAEMEEELADLRRQAFVQLFTQTETFAADLARQMLSERAHPVHWLSHACYHWRARVLGPEVAAADRDYALGNGWGHCHWDEDGRLRPLGPGQAEFADTVERFVEETTSGATPAERPISASGRPCRRDRV